MARAPHECPDAEDSDRLAGELCCWMWRVWCLAEQRYLLTGYGAQPYDQLMHMQALSSSLLFLTASLSMLVFTTSCALVGVLYVLMSLVAVAGRVPQLSNCWPCSQ